MRSLTTALLLAGLFAGLARASEKGLPAVLVHDQRQHGGGSQIFDATQSADGLLHFGGLHGLVTYDGAWWQTLALPNDSAVFAVESGRGPEIAVGAVQEMGWVGRDAGGAPVYRSLLPLLPPHARGVGDVRAICTTATGFLFAAESFVVAWSGGAPSVVADLRGRGLTAPPRCARAGSSTYVMFDTGLYRYDEPAQKLVSAGFDDKTVDAVLAFDASRLLVAVRGEGLQLASGSSVSPFATPANELLRGRVVTAAASLPNGQFLIGTRHDGALVVGRSGAVEERLDAAAGLPDNVLTGALVDREGALWLTYYGKIARLELDSPVSLFDARRGLRGGAQSVERHRGRTYIASQHGLFAIDPAAASIRAVGAMSGMTFDAVSVDGEALIGTREGVYVVGEDETARRIGGTGALPTYELARSKRDPARVWAATKRGVAVLRRNAGGWQLEGVIAGTPPHVHHVVEIGDDLWAGSVFDGAARVPVVDGSAAAPRRIETYGKGETFVTAIGGRPAIVIGSRILQPLPGGRLAPHPLLGHLTGNFYSVSEDARGNVWLAGEPPRIVRRLPGGAYAREALPIVSIDPPQTTRVQADGDVVWLTSPEVLYRYDAARSPVALPQPVPRIRRAVAGENERVTAPLRPAFGRLHIEFAPVSYRAGVVYQYRLDPVDRDWSVWTPQPSIDYTNLDRGEYTFRLRARGSSGAVSEETRWSFSVLPPWYRTRPALALWAIVAAVTVAAFVRLRTGALRRQADRLRALVFERTEALQQANAHLERLSLLDELTGIANRRYFQRAMAEEWRRAHEQRQRVALVLFDLDHFKQLNDRYGHAAGDAALIQVARQLSRAARRSGEVASRPNDLIARIGGEEFALLLAGASEPEALQVAELLRGGIERLPIPIYSSTVHITVSAGVAVTVPLETEGWDALMRDADRALYDAKAAGRNCVRAAGGREELQGAAAS